MTTATAEIFRKDYKPLPVSVLTIDLSFNLNEESTAVQSKMRWRRTAAIEEDLVLNGRKDVTLTSITLDGVALEAGKHYTLEPSRLVLHKTAIPPTAEEWSIEIATVIEPQKNTLLEGLYTSGGNYCTQCEAEGFRGITYFFDRPDVMSKYSTRIEADKKLYPVLLSNGNLVSSGDIDNGRHFAVWVDPWAKPCYLFALVAGDLKPTEDTFVTKSGRKVVLRIFVAEKNVSRTGFAMASLKRAMKWDEDTFGLEYDLDLFNIVAVDDFNMGAMENKSLNIFNSRLILATPETASDLDFTRIESVVGHEYFHNWTGNRVTCRDWFQLTLKEGLTVYRDQEFSSDMNSRPVKRLSCVSGLRKFQFEEDRGPMAHPVRPDSYVKMDNFYTATVYNKGAEVIRMYEMVVGKAGFRKGMDLYFQRHDGHAVTCDDFLAAMADANNVDLSALARWYSQAGTPELTVATSFDPAVNGGTFTVKLSQRTPPTRGQPTKVPVLIPIRTALLGKDGQLLPLSIAGKGAVGTETVLLFTEAEETVVFENVGADRPVGSFLRGFSSPVQMTVVGQTDEDLLHLLRYDNDAFNRYEAGQAISRKIALALYNGPEDFEAQGVPESLITAFRAILADTQVDGAFKEQALSLPGSAELMASIPLCDPVRLQKILDFISKTVAKRLEVEFRAIVDGAPAVEPEYQFSSVEVARRALINLAFSYLSQLRLPEIDAKLLARLKNATNQTTEAAALNALNHSPECRGEALRHYRQKWASEPLVLLKWLGAQARCDLPGNTAELVKLMNSDDFKITNPNNCYSVFVGYAMTSYNYHAADGSGYRFVADAVLQIDKVNHQVAARVIEPLTLFGSFDLARQALMKAELQRILATPDISDNIREHAEKAVHP